MCSCRVRNQKITGGMKEALHKCFLYGMPPHRITKQHLVILSTAKALPLRCSCSFALLMQLCARRESIYICTVSHLEKTLHRSLRRRALFQGRKPRGFGSHHRPILVVGTHGGPSRQGPLAKPSVLLLGPPPSAGKQPAEAVLLQKKLPCEDVNARDTARVLCISQHHSVLDWYHHILLTWDKEAMRRRMIIGARIINIVIFC